MDVKFPETLEKELGRCIGCGACNIPCPMYHVEDLKETEGARARIKLLSMLSRDRIELTVEFLDYLLSCMNCGLCSNFCPVDINVFDVIVSSRSALIDMGFVPLVTLDMREVNKKTGSPIGDKITKGVWLPPDFQPKRNADVLFFAGCWVHTLPEVALNTLKLLRKVSKDVVPAGTDEPCCGGVLYTLGEKDSSKEHRDKLKGFLEKLSPKQVVSGCSLCANMFPELGLQDMYTFIEKGLKENRIKAKSLKGKRRRIFLVPSCRSDGAAIRILESIENAQVLDVPEWVCCDCGATLMYQAEPDRFEKWLRKVVEIARYMDADLLVFEEVSCYSMVYEIGEGKNKVDGIKVVSLPSFLLDHISEVRN